MRALTCEPVNRESEDTRFRLYDVEDSDPTDADNLIGEAQVNPGALRFVLEETDVPFVLGNFSIGREGQLYVPSIADIQYVVTTLLLHQILSERCLREAEVRFANVGGDVDELCLGKCRFTYLAPWRENLETTTVPFASAAIPVSVRSRFDFDDESELPKVEWVFDEREGAGRAIAEAMRRCPVPSLCVEDIERSGLGVGESMGLPGTGLSLKAFLDKAGF